MGAHKVEHVGTQRIERAELAAARWDKLQSRLEAVERRRAADGRARRADAVAAGAVAGFKAHVPETALKELAGGEQKLTPLA